MNKWLTPAALKELRPLMVETMTDKIECLMGSNWVDAIKSLASHLSLQIVANLVGPPDINRQSMLTWATATFNRIGHLEKDDPIAARLKDDLVSLNEAREWGLRCT